MTPTNPPPRVKFAACLLRWHALHGRKSLPWQNRRDVYGIWVAEIMLQQTRVSTVIPYYQDFLARFPDISALAHCELDALLHCWSGLGYYARARNLRAAAQIIIAQYGGKFPDNMAQTLALPGIGRSTAGAILAAAFGQRHPILDGNVKRVLSRYYAIGGDGKVEVRLWNIAEQLTPKTRVADYNQAIMDLGATVCMRAKPQCERCPLASECTALACGTPTAFPQPKAKPVRPCKTVTMLMVENQHAELLLVKRPPSGIWGGLWSLPEYAHEIMHKNTPTTRRPTHENFPVAMLPIEQWFERQFGLGVKTGQPLPPIRHSFTHFDLDIRPLPAMVTQTSSAIMDAEQYLWYNPLSPAQVGLPTAVKRILGMLK